MRFPNCAIRNAIGGVRLGEARGVRREDALGRAPRFSCRRAPVTEHRRNHSGTTRAAPAALAAQPRCRSWKASAFRLPAPCRLSQLRGLRAKVFRIEHGSAAKARDVARRRMAKHRNAPGVSRASRKTQSTLIASSKRKIAEIELHKTSQWS